MITLTDTAVTEVKRLMAQQGMKDAMLRVGVQGGGCSGLQYAMNFDNHQSEHDQTFEFDGLKVVCDAKSYLYLNGITVDFAHDMLGGGFKFSNPNAQRECGCGTSFSAWFAGIVIKIDLAEYADSGIIREESFRARVARLDLEGFRDQDVFIKGCGKLPIPTWAFVMIALHVAQVAASISFGEEARPQLLFERAPTPIA